MLRVNNIFMTWEEMKLRYPDKWVVAINYTLDRANFLNSGNVIAVCEDSEIDSFRISCYKNGIDFRHRRTTSKSFIGVITQYNKS